MATVYDWISAARLRTLPLSLSNILMGGILSYHLGSFDALLFGLISLTAVLLQILSNFANDYGDALSGVDGSGRQGPARAMQIGVISRYAMCRAIVVTALAALVSGLALIYASPLSFVYKVIFVALGLCALWAAVRYTAGDRPYGYRALGDISVFLFFGLVAVIGTFIILGGQFRWTLLLPAVTCGLFSVAVLNINNIRDITSDKAAGKLSFAIVLGRRKAVIYHGLLLGIGLLTSVLFTILCYRSPSQWLFLVALPLLIKNWWGVYQHEDPRLLDPFLREMALTTLFFVVLFGVGLSV